MKPRLNQITSVPTNPPSLKINSIHSSKVGAAVLVSSFALICATAQGAITINNTAFGVTNNNHNSSKPNPSGDFAYNSTTKIYSLSYNAGATSDMLVLSMSVETGSGSIAISYGGSALTQAVSSGTPSAASIWYLANPAATGTLTIDASSFATFNGFGIGIASLNGNGQEIGLHTVGSTSLTSNLTTLTTVGITTTVADSFIMVAADANNNLSTTTPSLNTPLTQIYANGDVGSSKGAAGYQNAVGIGAQSFGFTSAASETRYNMVAASFVTIPEPSAAVLGSLGLLALVRRRRA